MSNEKTIRMQDEKFSALIMAHKASVEEVIRLRESAKKLCYAIENGAALTGIIRRADEMMEEIDGPWTVEESNKAIADAIESSLERVGGES